MRGRGFNESLCVNALNAINTSIHTSGRNSSLRSTLAHEMCHVAAWTIDRQFHPHHGTAFWKWAGDYCEPGGGGGGDDMNLSWKGE